MPTATRTPYVSIAQEAGIDKGMNTNIQIIARRPMASSVTPSPAAAALVIGA